MFREYAIMVVNVTCDVLSAVILLYVLGSWVVSRDNKAFIFVESLAKPILSPIKKLFPPNGIDFSPMVAFLGIELIGNLLVALISSI